MKEWTSLPRPMAGYENGYEIPSNTHSSTKPLMLNLFTH
jgi:hypothetical protein